MCDLTERVSRALKTIEDFTAVQHGADHATMKEAVLCLQAAAGVDDEVRLVLCDGLQEMGRFDEAGPILLGMLLALFASGAEVATALPGAALSVTPDQRGGE